MNPEDWIPPTYRDLRTKNFEKYPFHCDVCGTELSYRNPEYEYIPGHNRVILSNFGKIVLCGPCLGKRIAAWFKNPGTRQKWEGPAWADLPVEGECDICQKKAAVARSIQSFTHGIDCRFGSQWWNGYKICCDCLVETASNGKPKSGIIANVNGQWVHINEVGAAVRQNP